MTVERALRLVAGLFVMLSVLLGIFVHVNFLWFTLFVGANLLQSAFTNWCPMMSILRRAGVGASLVCAAVALSGSTALAQPDVAPRTAISFAGGAASTTSATGVALGGSWLFDLNERTSLEAQGTYLDRGAGSDALSVNGSVIVHLLSARERIVPYAAAGAGIYRTSFDLAHPGLLGPVGAQFGPGSVVCPAAATGTCPATAAGYWGVGQMPGFYARRFGPMTVPVGGAWQTRSFTDPAMSFGGGLRFNVSPHVMVRPDVRALVVFGDGDTHTVGMFGVQLGYRF